MYQPIGSISSHSSHIYSVSYFSQFTWPLVNIKGFLIGIRKRLVIGWSVRVRSIWSSADISVLCDAFQNVFQFDSDFYLNYFVRFDFHQFIYWNSSPLYNGIQRNELFSTNVTGMTCISDENGYTCISKNSSYSDTNISYGALYSLWWGLPDRYWKIPYESEYVLHFQTS